VLWWSIGCAAREIASTAARAMPTITVVPHVGVLDATRWEADESAPGGYGEWGARGAVPVAALQCAVGPGRRAVCVAWWWCAGAFTNATTGHRVTRHVGSGYFSVSKYRGKWRGQVNARGVPLHTSYHAEAWQAAVELEWLLGLWCAKHGEWGSVGCRCVACAPWLLAGVRLVRRCASERVCEQPAAAAGGGPRGVGRWTGGGDGG